MQYSDTYTHAVPHDTDFWQGFQHITLIPQCSYLTTATAGLLSSDSYFSHRWVISTLPYLPPALHPHHDAPPGVASVYLIDQLAAWEGSLSSTRPI